MNARTWLRVGLAAALAAATGCKDKAREISQADYLLAQQHEAWERARQALRSDPPKLEDLRTVDLFLGGRTARRVAKDYSGSNQAEVVAKLKALGKAYQEQVSSKLTLMDVQVRLKPGATLEQLRAAFGALEDDYRALEEMAPGKK